MKGILLKLSLVCYLLFWHLFPKHGCGDHKSLMQAACGVRWWMSFVSLVLFPSMHSSLSCYQLSSTDWSLEKLQHGKLGYKGHPICVFCRCRLWTRDCVYFECSFTQTPESVADEMFICLAYWWSGNLIKLGYQQSKWCWVKPYNV